MEEKHLDSSENIECTLCPGETSTPSAPMFLFLNVAGPSQNCLELKARKNIPIIISNCPVCFGWPLGCCILSCSIVLVLFEAFCSLICTDTNEACLFVMRIFEELPILFSKLVCNDHKGTAVDGLASLGTLPRFDVKCDIPVIMPALLSESQQFCWTLGFKWSNEKSVN